MTTILDIAAVLSAIVWPVVILILVLAFRDRLPDLVERLAGRVTKLSVFEVSIELATVPAPPSPWSDPNIPESSQMLGNEVNSTALMTLFERIGVETAWDYLIVDTKNGESWLISRLFIFTVFLHEMRGVKCVVFVESENENYRRLLGLASAEDVRTTLSAEYDWLEKALSAAMIKQNTTSLNPSLSPGTAGEIIREFIEQPEMRSGSLPSPPDKWTQLGTHPIWEHTEWLTSEKVTEYLRRVFYEWDSSHYMDTPDTQVDRTRDVLRRTAPYIGLVNSKGEFKSLLNRRKLLEQVDASL